MSKARFVTKGPRVAAAVKELQDLILSKYPGTEFCVRRGEDPTGTYLVATVDLDEPDEVMNVVVDRVLDLLVDEGIFIVVVPVRTSERAAKLDRRLATLQPYAAATVG